MNMSRSAAKASELADAAGLTSRSVDHRMQVAKMQVELNARRAQTELDEAVASQIKLLEKRVNKSNDKADAALLLKEPAEVNLTEATFTEKEMKAAANIAKAKFVEARSKYQLALKEEENQKAELAKREREWKARIETEKRKVAKSRLEVVDSQSNEEKKKATKNKARLEVLNFKNPYRIQHARAKVNASIAEGLMEEARNAERIANRTLSMVTADFKLAEYHHSQWSEKLRKRFGYKEGEMDGGYPEGIHMSEYQDYNPTGATGMAKLSPEDLAEMQASSEDLGDSATGASASGATGASASGATGASASGASGIRFKSITTGGTGITGGTGNAGMVDMDSNEDNLNDEQSREVDVAAKIANKGFKLIAKYSDAHRLLVDTMNKKDEATTGVKTLTATIKELESRLNTISAQKADLERENAAARSDLFRSVREFMKASKALRQAKQAERENNQKVLDETKQSVSEYQLKKEETNRAFQKATQVKLQLDEKKSEVDESI